MDNPESKSFSIVDSNDVNTVIYKINKTPIHELVNSPRFTVERLEFEEEIRKDSKKKTFFVEDIQKEGNELVILSFGKEKVVVNVGVLENEKVKISKKPIPVKFNTLYNEVETDYKDFKYTPNLKRPISIIDPETTEEIKPVLYIDENTDEVRGKIQLQPFKSYFAFEINESK